ncbi:MAG: DUF1552 domain-containing protein [Pseudomonadota bacterium]
MKKTMNRRRFLRCSAGGTSAMVALPLLPSMFASDAAYAAEVADKQRFFAFYVPNSTVEPRWFPQNPQKKDFSLMGTGLEAFEVAGHKEKISLYQGMYCVGQNGTGNPHMRAIAGFLTGAAIPNDRIQNHKISLDKALANYHQANNSTRIHSLQLSGNPELDAANNNNYNNRLKNALNFNAQGQIMPTEANIKAVYDRLFAGANQEETDNAINRRAELKLSVLDQVKADREKIMSRLGASDKIIVEEYFESIRQVEQQIDALTQPVVCNVTPMDVPTYSNTARNNAIGEHSRITSKILALAFQCDVTRVATYMAGGEAAGCNYNDININMHFHNAISHSRNNAAQAERHHQIDRFHSELVANFMTELENIPSGEGSLLDNTCIVYGSGLANGTTHSLNGISLLVAGNFGEFEHGTYHNLTNRNHADLMNTLYQQMGLPDDQFGDSFLTVPVA